MSMTKVLLRRVTGKQKRQKALLLRAELASGAVVVASGLNVVQQLVPAPAAAAGQAVDPQSAWLLRKMLTYASKLVAAQP